MRSALITLFSTVRGETADQFSGYRHPRRLKLGYRLRNWVPIYFIQYEARPNPESDDFVRCGGGFVNCWVKSSNPNEAKEVATKTINENNWHIVAVEEDCREVSESSYSEEEGLEHYEQAVLDGECYVFHTWRNEPQDDSERH